MTIYRVHLTEYGDGYEDFVSRTEAELAKQEWEAEYGDGEAWITEED